MDFKMKREQYVYHFKELDEVNKDNLQELIENKYPFLNRMKPICSNNLDEKAELNPLIKSSVFITLEAIYNSSLNKRIVIVFPCALESAAWVSSLATPWIMKKDFENNVDLKIKVTKGQKVLLNGCVVEYVGEVFEKYLNITTVKVKCSNGNYQFPIDHILEIHPITGDRPLDSIEKIKSYRYKEAIEGNFDEILAINTKGNRQFFSDNIVLVSKIASIEKFINSKYINGNRIVDLFLWGKISITGEPVLMNQTKYQADPSCLVASDFNRLYEYLSNKRELVKAVCIDGVEQCTKQHLDVLDYVIEQDIPIIAITEMSEVEYMNHFIDRDFTIWHWNRNLVKEAYKYYNINETSQFHSLDDRFINYISGEVKIIECSYPLLEDLFNKLKILDKHVKELENPLIVDITDKIRWGVFSISRFLHIPDKNWVGKYGSEMQDYFSELEGHKLWFKKDTNELIEDIIDDFLKLIKSLFVETGNKIEKIGDLFFFLEEDERTMIVLSDEKNALRAMDYWETKIQKSKRNNIKFSFYDSLEDDIKGFTPHMIVVCGWLNQKKMHRLLHLFLTPEIRLLFYPFECEWFKNACKKWQKTNDFTKNNSKVIDILGIKSSKTNHEDNSSSFDKEVDFQEISFIDEFELKRREQHYKRYIAGNLTREAIKAKQLTFSNKRFAFVSESHKLLVLSDFIIKDNPLMEDKIPRKTISHIRNGDYVLFRDSDRDIIREVADEGLEKEGLGHLREISGLWQDALRTRFGMLGKDFNLLADFLKKHGCKRHPVTIKNWIIDETMIAPNDKIDRRIIMDALGLLDKFELMEEAIAKVRSAHLQASSFLIRKLVAELPQIIKIQKEKYGFTSCSLEVDMEHLGKISILRVSEIGEQWLDIQPGYVNRLLVEEGELPWPG